MTRTEIAHHRLCSQRIVRGEPRAPGQIAAHFGAMQAQDYAGVCWAIGLRSGATDAQVEQAIEQGTIVRTWLLRGTLQVVAAPDLRWMLALLGPGQIAGSARRYRLLGLDEATFARGYGILGKVLEGHEPVGRTELLSILEQEGVSTDGQRGYHILRRAALEGTICFGPPQGKEETFVWLDDWVPPRPEKARESALAGLAERYFRSHGPASLRDFVWWSGLPVSEARRGLDGALSRLRQETVDGQACWLPQEGPLSGDGSPAVHLLPAYDEYYLGYRTRSAVLDPCYDPRAVSRNGVFRPLIVVDGQVVGIWKQTHEKRGVTITPSLFRPLTAVEEHALGEAAARYAHYLDLPATLAASGFL